MIVAAVRRLALALLATMGGVGVEEGVRYVVHAPAELAAGAAPALRDLTADLARLTGIRVALAGLPAPPCQAGEVHVLLLGHQSGGQALDAQEYRIEEERCDSGRRVVLRGGSLLAGQWAAYDFLERLGVRYFHPEETLYPPRPRWPATPIAVQARPAFARRSIHVHRDHPVELSPPLPPTTLDMAAYQRRWIDWNVKLRASAVDGFDEDLVGGYAWLRGFPREASLNLLNGQQGGRPILDPDDARPDAVQIAEAVDELLRPSPGRPAASSLTVQFNPSEFSEADEDKTVARLTAVADRLRLRHPGVRGFAINHGTHGAPMKKRGVRFFDLPAFAPPNLGVKVHSLMFYDLERPAAGVYGNQDFGALLRFTREQQKQRPIIHYPEASWWLTFDLPVPLFFAPATLEARQHDIDLLRPFLAARPDADHGVVGHHLFSSGQEWGYWLIDYCVLRMSFDLGLTHGRCLDDFTAQLAGGPEIRAVLAEVEAAQVTELRTPALLRFLVGSDDEVETAAGLGLRFHPLPPAPAEVAAYDDAQVAELRADSLTPLAALAARYHTWAHRLEGLLSRQSAAQAPWLRELRDGLRIFALRAEHAIAIYEGALCVREHARAAEPDRRVLATALSRARALTGAARQVVRRRELDYRYPRALSIAGGERGTPAAVRNRTIYPYRYLQRTHTLHYWTRPDEQLATLVRQVGRKGAPVAVAGTRVVFAKGALHVESPAEARKIEGLLPGLEALLADDGAPFLELRTTGTSDTPGEPWRSERIGPRAGPADLPLALRSLGELVVREAVVEVAARAPKAELTIRGNLRIDDIIALMVKSGGFEATGARTVLALTLGYTPARLPAALPVTLKAEGRI